jgi:hypothetical protein
MKLKRHVYSNYLERLIHFSLGLFYFSTINHVLTCGLVLAYNQGYTEARQPPFPIEITLCGLGGVNILVFLLFSQTARWVAIGILAALIVNELIWLGLGVRDPLTIIMPFWMAIGYD